MIDRRSKKKMIGRWLTIISALLTAFHFYTLWVVVSTFAVGLVGWAEPLAGLGPPLALVALGVALWKPQQVLAAILNSCFLLLYAVVWLPPLIRGDIRMSW